MLALFKYIYKTKPFLGCFVSIFFYCFFLSLYQLFVNSDYGIVNLMILSSPWSSIASAYTLNLKFNSFQLLLIYLFFSIIAGIQWGFLFNFIFNIFKKNKHH
jgi:hypothetical protein